MDRQDVQAFLAVAEELHFGRAASRLHMAQPPLSRLIQKLEHRLGAPLFDRTTRSVRLTPQGEALLEPARVVAEAFRTAERAVLYAHQGIAGHVRVGFAGPSSHNLVSTLAKHVRRDEPGIELSLTSTLYGAEALESVASGSLDIAFVRWDNPPPGFASKIVRVEHYVLVVPQNHRLAERTSVSIAELVDERWILLERTSGSSLRAAVLRKAEDAGFAPRVALEARDTWTIIAMVAAEMGVAMTVNTTFEAVTTEGVCVIPLDEGKQTSLVRLAWPREQVSPALRRVLAISERALPTPSGWEDQ